MWVPSKCSECRQIFSCRRKPELNMLQKLFCFLLNLNNVFFHILDRSIEGESNFTRE